MEIEVEYFPHCGLQCSATVPALHLLWIVAAVLQRPCVYTSERDTLTFWVSVLLPHTVGNNTTRVAIRELKPPFRCSNCVSLFFFFFLNKVCISSLIMFLSKTRKLCFIYVYGLFLLYFLSKVCFFRLTLSYFMHLNNVLKSNWQTANISHFYRLFLKHILYAYFTYFIFWHT